MMLLDNLEENTVYEVLVATLNKDDSVHVKPFGVKIVDGHVVLNLFANRTLSNIMDNGNFTLYFLQDVLLFTESFLGELDVEKLRSNSAYELFCEVIGSETRDVNDSYGKNTITMIIAEAVKLIKHKEYIPVINRPSSQLIELLVDFSRYDFMDVYEKEIFIKKVDSTEKLIKKAGNKKHLNALNLIKKELKK